MKTRMIAITGETHFTNSKIDSTMSPKPLGGSSGQYRYLPQTGIRTLKICAFTIVPFKTI